MDGFCTSTTMGLSSHKHMFLRKYGKGEEYSLLTYGISVCPDVKLYLKCSRPRNIFRIFKKS
jgi:hypothetical protein